MKLSADAICVDPRKRRLAGARRAPQNEREDVALFDREPERFARADQMALTDELAEIVRPDTAGERFHKGIYRIYHKRRALV